MRPAPHLSAVHPHVCGEHGCRFICRQCYYGSSPRMWGTHTKVLNGQKNMRFIPTYVGNTRKGGGRQTITPVHPHVCGEHLDRGHNRQLARGSSPRMWGTLDFVPIFFNFPRFIPTYVGNTTLGWGVHNIVSVHPHVCGEHSLIKTGIDTKRGSSPRMWGTPALLATVNLSSRFIPTYVGNTLGIAQVQHHSTVHPHVCGEHSHLGRSKTSVGGSSPRMWGTHLETGS